MIDTIEDRSIETILERASKAGQEHVILRSMISKCSDGALIDFVLDNMDLFEYGQTAQSFWLYCQISFERLNKL